MNLRQKNKKLKRELEEAKETIARATKCIEQARRTTREAKDYINKLHCDIGTLRAYVHRPEYTGLSEEQIKAQIVKRFIPELAKCVTMEDCTYHDDVLFASLRVVMPRE